MSGNLGESPVQRAYVGTLGWMRVQEHVRSYVVTAANEELRRQRELVLRGLHATDIEWGIDKVGDFPGRTVVMEGVYEDEAGDGMIRFGDIYYRGNCTPSRNTITNGIRIDAYDEELPEELLVEEDSVFMLQELVSSQV